MPATYSSRSLMIFVAIVAIYLGVATQIAESSYLSETIQLLAVIPLAVFSVAAFLVFALRARLGWFTKLSIFVSGKDKVALAIW